MPRFSKQAENLLSHLEAAKNAFDPGHASVVAKLITRLSNIQFTDSNLLIRFHECLLFLRAFPHAQAHISKVEYLLDTFQKRVDKLRALGGDITLFDDFDASGIAGTIMQDSLSFDVARWLARTIPRHVDIAWKDYWEDCESERSRGNTWPRFVPLLEEDADVEANIPWKRWLEAARGRKPSLQWLLACFDRLALTPRQRSELYDSLRLPIRWRLENLKLSRTRNWSRPRRFYFHEVPLIQRSDVSLTHEIARTTPKFEKLSLAAGEKVMQAIREIMVVRYRELYGTTLGDPRSVVRVDVGRGVVMHFWGLPPSRRLPLRAYLAGYTLKNGVPVNYIEAIGLCDWIEVGFNTFYTYRQGETAWIYAQALRCLRGLTGASTISIYPYQIGQNNDEAIDSGAFWFYRKLGFRSGRPDLQKLCEREERKIAADPRYRTSPRILKRLAEANMFLELKPVERLAWATFSTRNLGLTVSRRMAEKYHGDSGRLRAASTAAVTRALPIKLLRWSVLQRQSLENWSLVLALIPDLARWADDEKRQVIEVIRSKSSSTEMHYLRQTQRHARLRSEILRLGS